MLPPEGHACPSPHRFPFVLAAAAGTALDDLIDQDGVVAEAAATASATIEGRAFEGATADRFWSSYQGRMEARGYGGIWLVSERGRVDTLIADALIAESERDAEIQACSASHD